MAKLSIYTTLCDSYTVVNGTWTTSEVFIVFNVNPSWKSTLCLCLNVKFHYYLFCNPLCLLIPFRFIHLSAFLLHPRLAKEFQQRDPNRIFMVHHVSSTSEEHGKPSSQGIPCFLTRVDLCWAQLPSRRNLFLCKEAQALKKKPAMFCHIYIYLML